MSICDSEEYFKRATRISKGYSVEAGYFLTGESSYNGLKALHFWCITQNCIRCVAVSGSFFFVKNMETEEGCVAG